jgi:hypothetical protein
MFKTDISVIKVEAYFKQRNCSCLVPREGCIIYSGILILTFVVEQHHYK